MEKDTILSRCTPFTGAIFAVQHLDILLPNGRKAGRDVVRKASACAVVPITANGEILLVEQYRIPMDGFVLELPAGLLEPGELPLACAQRELMEETGYHGGHWQQLAVLATSPGFTDECIHLFLAQDILPGPSHPDDEENIRIHSLPVTSCLSLMGNQPFQDAKTMAGILLAQSYLAKK